MAVLDLDGLAEASQLVARVAIQQIRQATATLTPSPTSAASSTASPTSTSSINSGNNTSDGNNNSNSSSGGQSSPLLFFVALGFGVVFTNLWIIVGVKYCFRYNARNRQLRGEDGQPITLDQLPPHPRRRRREKKLMSIEEVNEKFPMTKYKTWVSSRAQEGLPTQGGVSVAPSRANSLREAEGIIPAKERESTDERPGTSATIRKDDILAGEKTNEQPTIGHTTTTTPTHTTNIRPATASPTTAHVDSETTTQHDTHDHDDDDKDEDDEEVITTAVPSDLLNGSGDTCAICIDTLEDDDDIRGLTCGHAFHAVCLDPWLTSRRACCPLCKADYYTPKPRPQDADLGDASVPTLHHATNNAGVVGPNMPSRPGATWVGSLGRGDGEPGRLRMFSRFNNPLTVNENTPPSRMPYMLRGRRSSPMMPSSTSTVPPTRGMTGTASNAETTNNTNGAGDPVEPVRWWNMSQHGSQLRMPRLGRRRNNAGSVAPPPTAAPTPSDLEAGIV